MQIALKKRHLVDYQAKIDQLSRLVVEARTNLEALESSRRAKQQQYVTLHMEEAGGGGALHHCPHCNKHISGPLLPCDCPSSETSNEQE